MQEHLEDAIALVNQSTDAYCHYITPNDIGLTGGHQCGFYFSHEAEPMFYGYTQQRGRNDEAFIEIRWQKDWTTLSRTVYYGTGTRNENRITRFGRGFEFMQEEYLGALMIITKGEAGNFDGYVLANQDNIERFMETFNLNVSTSNHLITRDHQTLPPEEALDRSIREIIQGWQDFPSTTEMAEQAQHLVCSVLGFQRAHLTTKCDSILLQWVDAEFRLFRALEEQLYQHIYTQPFSSCQQLIDFSNSILNRRKSRAGKSLEHHLAMLFRAANLRFEEQAVTEENKKPDFIFPSGEDYHNFTFPAEKLTMLGAKTTCKDRWRQVLNEANRIPQKHLFTLQQGISSNQLKEMKAEGLTLVVPKAHISLFHPAFQADIMPLHTFIQYVKEQQA